MRKAFTLIELVVALGIMALVLSFAGVIFRVSIDSHRLALANAEIMQKLRVIMGQLDADFRGLRKDGEILAIWAAVRKDDYAGSNPNDPDAFERFDRIMFFTSGDFQTYGTPTLRGNVARVCYTLARGPSEDSDEPNLPPAQKPQNRILARTQHILIPPTDPGDQLDTSSFDDAEWIAWSSQQEYDSISLAGWRQMPLAEKVDILSVIGDVEIEGLFNSTTDKTVRGVLIDPSEPESLHALLCRGVGEFIVQGWSDEQQRWIPEVNPNGDDSLEDDSDFLLEDGDLHPRNHPGVWYPKGALTLRNVDSSSVDIDREHLSVIPGLGRALKFTFTLYDSRGLIANGRTFTHIVYLDD